MNVTVKFGPGNSTTSNRWSTIGDLQNDAALRAFLGYGESVQFYMHGQAMPSNVQLHEGDVVTVQQAASEKGN